MFKLFYILAKILMIVFGTYFICITLARDIKSIRRLILVIVIIICICILYIFTGNMLFIIMK